jgi:hypothetical protein
MHGVTISRENGGKDRWCPLMFGFLLDFFYWCGVIGHTEKLCTEKSEKGAQLQYDKKLRYVPEI